MPEKIIVASARSRKRRADPRFSIFAAFCLALAAASGGAAADDRFDELMRHLQGNPLPAGFASANGRIESEKVEIATKWPGRIAEVLVKEGDIVEQGQVLARIEVTDT